MRLKRCVTAAVALAAVAIPVSAAIKAMTLKELMEITSEVFYGEIIAKDTEHVGRPFPEAVYTRLTIEGESLRTGEVTTKHVWFLGSHDPADGYITSESPAVQDTRIGNEVVVFSSREGMLQDVDYVYDWSGVYRVEHGFGEPVLIGKGEGGAFPVNVKLSHARERVREVHVALEKAGKAPGLKK